MTKSASKMDVLQVAMAVASAARIAANTTLPESQGGSSLPDQTGNAGKYLKTDGSEASWDTPAGSGDMTKSVYDTGNVESDIFEYADQAEADAKSYTDSEIASLDIDELVPDQTGNSGKYLTTDGSAVSWGTPAGGGSGDMTAAVYDTGNVASDIFDYADQAEADAKTYADAAVAVLEGTLATVATTGDYTDLVNTPAAPDIDSLLPSQTGNSGKFLTTNGSNASWGTPSGGGSSGWTILESWTQSVDGNISAVEADISGVTEVLILFDLVPGASSGWRCAQLSDDGGSTWFTSSGDYVTIASAGTESSENAFYSHATSSASARSGVLTIYGGSVTDALVSCFSPARGSPQYLRATRGPVNRVRAFINNGGSIAGNMTGGSVQILGR